MKSNRPGKERRTLHVPEWPQPIQRAWEEAFRPSHRLKKGDSASHLGPVSRQEIARRFGLFLGFLKRTGRLDQDAPAAAHVTAQNVEAYMADFAVQKISSVTAWNNIYKVRRAAQLLSPDQDFSWLAEIQKDLAFMMKPRSKLDRVVFAERFVEAGLTLIAEAKDRTQAEFVRARGIRNGLMLALLALCPIRPKNFAALEIGQTFRQVRGNWWIVLPARSTKMRSPEERPVPTWLNPYIDLYLKEARPILLDPKAAYQRVVDLLSLATAHETTRRGKTDQSACRGNHRGGDFTTPVSNSRRHYCRRCSQRYAASRKRAFKPQESANHREALQSRQQSQCGKRVRGNC